MRIAIFENIMTPGGHEIEFDRILVEELKSLGHSIEFYVPENFKFQLDYRVPSKKLCGHAVSYDNSRGLKKIFAATRREINRQYWYKQLLNYQTKFDALIIPTSTYRYLRTLNHSCLREISVPVVFILHGINPNEAPKFFKEIEKLLPYKNIKAIVLTLNEKKISSYKNVFQIYPPIYTARDSCEPLPQISNRILKLGFFGQYRCEKNLTELIELFLNGEYSREVELKVQGSTLNTKDAQNFEKIIYQYRDVKNLSFLHKGLIGKDWEQNILALDALLMPYSSSRYRFHWSGMLFTAIGFGKPVLASNDINPEIFQKYHIGETFENNNLNSLANALKEFINHFETNHSIYLENLKLASETFSAKKFALSLEKILNGSNV